jgi:hypothetical protein
MVLLASTLQGAFRLYVARSHYYSIKPILTRGAFYSIDPSSVPSTLPPDTHLRVLRRALPILVGPLLPLSITSKTYKYIIYT